jgi:hypothetical protein
MASFLLRLLLDPEDGDNKFLWNTGGHLPNKTALQPRTLYSNMVNGKRQVLTLEWGFGIFYIALTSGNMLEMKNP